MIEQSPLVFKPWMCDSLKHDLTQKCPQISELFLVTGHFESSHAQQAVSLISMALPAEEAVSCGQPLLCLGINDHKMTQFISLQDKKS